MFVPDRAAGQLMASSSTPTPPSNPAAGPRPAATRSGAAATCHVPLLVVCALRIERLALRTGDRSGAPAPLTVLRTGMGARAAERAVLRTLGSGSDSGSWPAGTAVVAVGFCAGLASGMRPGDLVVAEETRERDGRTRCTGTGLLAAALAERVRGRRPGCTVHTGPLAGAGRIVLGAARSRLHATGAVAADMESAVTLRAARAAGPRLLAAVRVVVDTPEHELARLGTLHGGVSAFRTLRTVMPAFHEWHRSVLLPGR